MRIRLKPMALSLALLATACGSGRYADGTYEGRDDSGEYPVVVSVDVRDGKIADLRYEDTGSEHGLFDAAFAEIRKSVIEEQGWEVDSVAGATVSSAGIKAAVKAALDAGRKR